MYSLTHTNAPETEKIITETGSFNDFPPGWQEITEEEFANSIYFSHSPDFIEYRQMRKNDKEPTVSTHLFHYWNKTGIAIVPQRPKNKPYSSTFDHVKYYRFGCEHEYKELSLEQSQEKGFKHFGNCWHIYECQECHHIYSQDSSG